MTLTFDVSHRKQGVSYIHEGEYFKFKVSATFVLYLWEGCIVCSICVMPFNEMNQKLM